MDWFPLYNSLRIAAIATVITFFAGLFAAQKVSGLPAWLKGLLDCVLTLPLVVPPTVAGFFLLKLMGPRGPAGRWALELWNLRLTMTWYASILAVVVVTFPLMYRTARGSLEAFDPNLRFAGQTLGRSDLWIFWRVTVPGCRQGLLAGTVLAFARGLGEYGATSMVSGYTPGRTATISTTVYQLWREGNDALAYRWAVLNLAISFCVLMGINLMERRNGKHRTAVRRKEGRAWG